MRANVVIVIWYRLFAVSFEIEFESILNFNSIFSVHRYQSPRSVNFAFGSFVMLANDPVYSSRFRIAFARTDRFLVGKVIGRERNHELVFLDCMRKWKMRCTFLSCEQRSKKKLSVLELHLTRRQRINAPPMNLCSKYFSTLTHFLFQSNKWTNAHGRQLQKHFHY